MVQPKATDCTFIAAVPVTGIWKRHKLDVPFGSNKPFVTSDGWLMARTHVDGTTLVGKFLKSHRRIDLVDLTGKIRKIRQGTLEVLKKPAPDVRIKWVRGTPGKAAPVGAVISGTKPDGTPLYAVRAVTRGVGRPGYYDPSKNCASAQYGNIICQGRFYYLTFVKGNLKEFCLFEKIYS